LLKAQKLIGKKTKNKGPVRKGKKRKKKSRASFFEQRRHDYVLGYENLPGFLSEEGRQGQRGGEKNG